MAENDHSVGEGDLRVLWPNQSLLKSCHIHVPRGDKFQAEETVHSRCWGQLFQSCLVITFHRSFLGVVCVCGNKLTSVLCAWILMLLKERQYCNLTLQPV